MLFSIFCACETSPCEGNREVQFHNRSTTGKTYDVIWNSTLIATLSPGAESEIFTVAGGSHTMSWRVSNSSTTVCTEANISIAECIQQNFSCSY